MASVRTSPSTLTSSSVSSSSSTSSPSPSTSPSTSTSTSTPSLFTSLQFLPEQLGHGRSSHVRLAQHTDTKTLYAVKCITRSSITTAQSTQILREKSILLSLSHPNLIPLLSTHHDTDHLYFIFPLYPYATLSQHITYTVRQRKRIPIDTVRLYCAWLVDVVCYLHEQGVAHRDITPKNIMLNQHGVLVLIDLGHAIRVNEEKQSNNKDNNSRTTSIVGTIHYHPPERITCAVTSEYACDWWCMGCILFELLTGRAPFWNDDEHVLRKKICQEEVEWPHYAVDGNAKALCEAWLTKDPSRRLTSPSSIRSHPFFSSISWSTLSTYPSPSFNTELGCTYYQQQQQKQRDEMENEDTHVFDDF